MLKKKNEMIQFIGRRHTKLGIGSTIIGAIVVITFITLSIISSTSNGNSGILVGFAGLILLAFSILGLRLSYKAFHERDVFYWFPIIGAVSNGFMTILLVVLYVYGVVYK